MKARKKNKKYYEQFEYYKNKYVKHPLLQELNDVEQAKLFGEMIRILMIEDDLLLTEAQSVISQYYNIPKKYIRFLLMYDDEYNLFAYDFLCYNKNKGNFQRRSNLPYKFNEILQRHFYKNKLIKENQDLFLLILKDVLEEKERRIVIE